MMTWKSTAVAGIATITATWLASYAPAGRPTGPQSSAATVAGTEQAALDIQREADRLHARIAQVTAYRDPNRNPFRFSARRAPARAPRPAPPTTIEEMPANLPPMEETLRVTLDGIAQDTVGEELVRTAIVSTPDDVFVVKVGDAIAGQFTVARIDADAVELVRFDTGASVRLSLRP
jgi:hypothetical protein